MLDEWSVHHPRATPPLSTHSSCPRAIFRIAQYVFARSTHSYTMHSSGHGRSWFTSRRT